MKPSYCGLPNLRRGGGTPLPAGRRVRWILRDGDHRATRRRRRARGYGNGVELIAEPKRWMKVTAPHCWARTPQCCRLRRAQLGEKRPHEGAEHLARELRVVGAPVAERVRKREHPLPDRYLGQDAVHEMGRRVGHAAAAAGRAEPAAACTRTQPGVVSTIVTVQAQKAMSQDAAAEEGAQLLQDEAGNGLIPALRSGEEGLQLLADDSVQEGPLGRPWRVATFGRCGRGDRSRAARRRGRDREERRLVLVRGRADRAGARERPQAAAREPGRARPDRRRRLRRQGHQAPGAGEARGGAEAEARAMPAP